MGYDVTHRVSADSQASGAQPIAMHVFDDLMTGVANVRMEAVATVGHPTQLLPLTAVVGVVAVGYYPNDGTGVARGGSITALQLAADAPDFDLAGLGFLIVGGPGLGALRGILSYDVPSRTLVPHRALPTTPTTSTLYRLGVITHGRKWLNIAAEYEDSLVATAGQIEPVFYDYPFDVRTTQAAGDHSGELGIAGVARKARTYSGRRQLVDNYGGTLDVRQPGYFTSRACSEDAVGSTLAKVRLVVPPAGGKHMALCGAAS